MKDVFEELEAEVAQHAVVRKHDAIELKNLLIANDNLIAKCLSQEVFCMATNSELNIARFTDMHVANTTAETCYLELEAELANLRETNNHDNQTELITHFSKLEVSHLNLQLNYQDLKDQIGNGPPTPDKDTPDFDLVFVIGKMQAFLQGKDNVIRQLKKELSKFQVTHQDTDRALRVQTTDSQITKSTNQVTHLQAQNDLFSAENDKIKQHYKELYDSIKITRAKHIEQVTKVTTKNMNLKTGVSKATVNLLVSARDKHAIDVEPIVPHLRNNKNAHLDYLRHLKESVETIRDIVEEAKVVRPLDRSIVSACRYTKNSQELLEYAIGTCPHGSQPRAKQLAYIPLIRKKQTTDSQITKLTNQVTHLQAQNDLFRAEIDKIKQHYKELYDSIKITRAKHIEQVTKVTTKNMNLKTGVSKATVNPLVSARDKHAIDVEPIVPRLRNNRNAHLDYLRHLKESVEMIRDIVEEAKVECPLPRRRLSLTTGNYSNPGMDYLISMHTRSNVRPIALFLDTKEKSSVPPHKMADVNAPSDQTSTMDPPVHTDDQILLHIRWIPIGKSNCYLDLEKSQSNPIYKIVDTILYDKKARCYKCQLDEQWFDLTKETLREALQITPVNRNQAFAAPPSINGLIDFVNQLGYPKPRAPVLQILWGIITGANIDYAERIWEEFTQSIHTFIEDKQNLSRHTSGKKRATLIVIPSVRFTKLIIHHLQRKHRFHPRPDSSLHLSNEEPVLGYLKGFLAGETRSTQDLPAPKPAKLARKPQSTAPKAPPKPLISSPVTSTQPAPTSVPAKTQENKHKQATGTTDKPAKAKRIKRSIFRKTHQSRGSPKSVGESEAEEVPAEKPQGPLSPVVIREPESGKYQPLPEVPGKGKAKVSEEQVTHDLLSLQKHKKTSPADQYIFQRRVSEPTASSFHDVSPNEVLGQSNSKEESEKIMLGVEKGSQDEGQARPDPNAQAKGQTGSNTSAQAEGQARSNPKETSEGQAGSNLDETSEGQAGPDPGNAEARVQSTSSLMVHAGSDREHMDIDVANNLKLVVEEPVLLEEPASSSRTLSSLQHLSRDFTFGDQFFSDKPSDADKSAETKVKSMKRKKGRESPKMPPGSPSHQPPPPPPPAGPSGTSGASRAFGSQASTLASNYSPPPENSLLVQTGDITTLMDWFCKRRGITELKPQDLEGPAYEIVKDIAAMYGISHWWFQRQRFYIDRHTSEGDRSTVKTHMRILSVVRIKVFSMYGYDYIKKIVLRRADLNEHVIAERDFKYLYPSDFEDLNLLNLQGHLNHLLLKDKKILTTAINQWTRQLVIRQRVEYFQLRIESYHTQVNLTKPQWMATGFEYKHDYTVIESSRFVIFRDKYGVQMMMRFNEIHKFSDGTLQQIVEALDYRVKEFRINRMNPGLNTRFWTRKDVDRCSAFMFAIQRRLKTHRIFRNLESFVRGRVRKGYYRLLKRTD
uniref:Uncharacterized protein n=1 Tax=Tanacetum cinerariifolium TaxID=118510 RepID=A0A6L2K1E1_TANCI|nr:hypothetical protein [Tanacetum cinerariifolium]